MKKRYFQNGAEMMKAYAANPWIGAYNLIILHDAACSPGICVCEPSYVLEDLTVDTYLAGKELEAAWRRSKTS